jgi:hypothetical protein
MAQKSQAAAYIVGSSNDIVGSSNDIVGSSNGIALAQG